MFESLLIANRGEIACRIIRTCRRLGIRSVAVWSEADRGARHVTEADDALFLGPAEAAKSYLDPARIVEAAARSGASAIHPGYGFLSENPVLARVCVEAGLVWVGPRAEVIAQMGSKIEAKKIARDAGVSLVPGYLGDDMTALRAEADRIGYPLLIKASAGGGGKGMRRVDRGEDLDAQLSLAKSEALRAFGDERVLLEKLVLRPRHLEVQLAGDRHGNLIHVFERECSVQRNYQKVIEEAPAANLPEPTRAKLLDYALRLGRAINYDSLGTVEFVLGADADEPYFLEMNTRLQVEHPVTEEITGLDLVELQLRIAAGERVPDQASIVARGTSIEARINCESPSEGYRPELGTIRAYEVPSTLRVESGVQVGTTVTPYYDAMIAKLVATAPTRAGAIRTLRRGLGAFETLGVGTNQLFVLDLLAEYGERPLSTDFIGDLYPDGWQPAPTLVVLALAVAAFVTLRPAAASTPWQATSGFRNVARKPAWARFVVHHDKGASTVWLGRRDGAWAVRIDGEEHAVTLAFDGDAHVRANDERFGFWRDAEGTWVSTLGVRWRVDVVPEVAALTAVTGASTTASGIVRASLPGLVTAVNVTVGQTVAAGDVVVVLESMKLMFALKAPAAGIVAAVHCRPGETVGNAAKLVEITPADTMAGLP